MFTNCPIDELLSAVEKAYSKFDQTKYDLKSPPTKDIIYLLKCILENNVFEFNGKLYKQQIGTAMGSVPSPEVCDILMFDILEEIYNRFQFKHKIYYSGRYRDDGFMIFHSNEEEFEQFFNIANNFHQSIKFTFNISKSHTDFLDIHIFKGNKFAESGKLDMKHTLSQLTHLSISSVIAAIINMCSQGSSKVKRYDLLEVQTMETIYMI